MNTQGILKIYEDTFITNIYTKKHFRKIGLIDVDIKYYYGVERVTLAFYSSSGTNDGKIKGLWYPIVGIKTRDGRFTEFSPYLNFVLSNVTMFGMANKGWLAKSLFFMSSKHQKEKIRGFSNGRYHESLLHIGETLRNLEESNKYHNMKTLKAKKLNQIITSNNIYKGNRYSQVENYERFIQDIFQELNLK